MTYDPFTCAICGKKMGRSTKPWWIIDPETLEVRGIAHKGCRDKLDYRTVEQRLTTPVEMWSPGGLVTAPPRELIEFAARMIKYRLSLPKWEVDVDFKVMMIAGKTYQATNVEELLELPKVKALFEWWADPSHRDPMPQDDLDEVKRRLREALGDAEVQEVTI